LKQFLIGCSKINLNYLRHKRATLLKVFSPDNASFVTCSNEQQVTSPLLESDTEYCYSEVYPSATNLFLELAEAFRSGVIFIDKGILSIDTQQSGGAIHVDDRTFSPRQC